MTPEDYARVKEVFLAACAKPPGDRAAFVAEACAGDEALRREVERMLSHHQTRPADSPARPDGRGLATAVAQGAILAAKMDEVPVFTAGHVVADRYRIVALAGEGAMGRVYRADDLRLRQTVALKFLPPDRCRDPVWRGRFEAEVRLARQIAHPNICRVYDIGEANGALFLSMEYVDGEDLSSLLRKVGRLAGDKAVDVARQLCVGLASAHIRGILHRDLKPGNVMLDARGRVCITDFGLAGLAGQVPQSEIRSGTPRYMAPEQLAGSAVTERSDIYSLGLLLYEIFTGRAAFDAKDLAGFAEQHATKMPPSPATIVPDIDRDVDAIIMQCLAKDAAARPNSALAVAAALPGNDLLTAALATGQIPSPSLVASAATGMHISRARMTALLVAFLGLMAVAIGVGRGAHPVMRSTAPRTPDWLRDRSREVCGLAGFNQPAVDTSARFVPAEGGMAAAEQLYRSGKWAFPGVNRTGLLFEYCERYAGEAEEPVFPLPFVASLTREFNIGQAPPGQVTAVLSPDGRLVMLEATPTYFEERTAGEPDLADLAKVSGMNLEAMSPAPPRLLKNVYAERRVAYSGAAADGSAVTIEAAMLGGRVYQYVMWRESAAPTATWARSASDRRAMVVSIRNTVFLLLLAAAIPAAVRSWRSGGDVRGAVRLAAAILALRLASNFLSAEHVRGYAEEVGVIAAAALAALCEALVIGVLYLALESHVRRIWPQTLVGWSRALSGRLRDPFVGRDVLIGAAFGAGWAALGLLDRQLPAWLGWHEREPLRVLTTPGLLFGPRFAVATGIDLLQTAVYQGLTLLIILVAARRVARHEAASAAIVCLVAIPIYVPAGCHPLTAWLCIGLGIVALAAVVMVRFGLLAAVTGVFIAHMLSSFPLTLDLQQWYAGYGLFAMAAALAVALFGFVHAGRATA